MDRQDLKDIRRRGLLMRRISVMTVLSLALAASSGSALARKKSIEDMPAAERGFIVGRLTFDCYFSPLPRYKGRCVPTTGEGVVAFKSDSGEKGGLRQSTYDRNGKPDVFDDEVKERGYDFCVPLKVGRYNITQLYYREVFPGANGFDLPAGFRKRFSVPFEVRPNEAVYLGDLKFSTEKTKTLIGIVVFRPDALVLRKGRDEEFERALLKCPSWADGASKRTAPLSEATLEPHPLVRLER